MLALQQSEYRAPGQAILEALVSCPQLQKRWRDKRYKKHIEQRIGDRQGVTDVQGARQLGKERAESGALTYMLSAREDAEFQQKASAEIQDVPNTIPAFK